ncbi:MAG TPA: UDP-N-acetylmuramoyl-L-alanine--D-glutamate ligase [Opitutales bacterium]|jgi:UDP-N-acetylmuramoylalanine--D-glutamate ligase|nr:UDP-N-acetylmuramoyl-L-alanine--D-glutamate ligase [Opitutales bacterium]
MNIPSAIALAARRPVAVLGFGVSGQAAALLLRQCGCGVEAYDEKAVPGVRADFSVTEAKRHDLVIYSPGFRQDHPWLVAARAAGCQCLGELDFASLFWQGTLIAVTGTNGKTTLTEFLATALRRQGISAVPAGNIGHPLSRLDDLGATQDRTAVCEISSFQAEGLQYLRPHALLWTNFDEDHLDRYAVLKDYFDAKWNLVERLAQPRLIVGVSVVQAAAKFGKKLPPHTVVVTREGAKNLVPAGSIFDSYPQSENYLVARAFWEQEGYPLNVLEETAQSFSTRKHRLARVAEWEGVTYWNDSKGTNFHATLAALETFSNPVVWIGGGKSKGGDIEGFAGRAAARVREAFLIGETAGILAAGLHHRGVAAIQCESLRQAVQKAHESARQSTPAQVLFSPGFSSFDMFHDYAERGLAFEQAVLGLKAARPGVIHEASPV